MENKPYGLLALYYDELNAHVPYDAWARYIADMFSEAGCDVRTVLDLACGTGAITYRLADMGYDMTGVDWSENMLSVAMGKGSLSDNLPLFIHQNIAYLDLYGTVDAAICCLDGINNLNPDDLFRSFERVHLFLNPGGIFIFDINSDKKLSALDGYTFVNESDNAFLACQCSYDKKLRMATFEMDLFYRQERGVYGRISEQQKEYAYTREEIITALEKAGFTSIKMRGELSKDPPASDEDRLFFSCLRG